MKIINKLIDFFNKLPHPLWTLKLIFKITILYFVLLGLYLAVMYVDIEPIATWRTLYIETAMITMDHQWLATYFIPNDVIAEVIGEQELQSIEIEKAVKQYQSSKAVSIKKNRSFFDKYNEIKKEELDEYIKESNIITNKDYKDLYINALNDGKNNTYLYTVHGEKVLILDEKNNILIVEVKGDNYIGKLAIVKDPSQVKLAVSSKYPKEGELAKAIVENNGAILGINASGFRDIDGHGNGGEALGLIMASGKLIQEPLYAPETMIGLDKSNKLFVGSTKNLNRLRDAVEFRPALIVNSKNIISGTGGWGLQPRTAVGQSKNGDILLLTIDGRQPLYSIGATMAECAAIMEGHNAVNAAAVDGGSSTIMVYNNEVISRPANKTKTGRRLPNMFVVTKNE